VREFKGAQNFVRKNFYIYLAVRKFAPFLCRFLDLEDGFSFLSNIQPSTGSIAIDVGSNDGTSIALISKHVIPVNVSCFDPVRAPISSTPSRAQISYFQFGLGDVTDNLSMFTPVVKGFRLTQYSSAQKGRLRHQLLHDLGLSIEDITLEEKVVQIRRLDDLDLRPFFIKIDVEGNELKVLRGSQETIRMHRPVILVEIQNEAFYKEISDFMATLRYANFAPSPPKFDKWSDVTLQTEFDTRYNNYLWLPIESSPNWTYK
jgi:FkbM family methyltransferase